MAHNIKYHISVHTTVRHVYVNFASNYQILSRNNKNRFLLGRKQEQDATGNVHDRGVRAILRAVPVGAVSQRYSSGDITYGKF